MSSNYKKPKQPWLLRRTVAINPRDANLHNVSLSHPAYHQLHTSARIAQIFPGQDICTHYSCMYVRTLVYIEHQNTVQLELRKMLPDLVNPKLCHEFYFVHRLDYPTSGIMCIALNKKAARAASFAFENQKVQKFYLALVHGHIREPHVIINKPIGDDIREKNGNHKMCTNDSVFCEKPRNSYTVLMVLEHGFWKNKPATKILLAPGTGRRHQLRVHCHYIGHTVIGDYTYSDGKDIQPHRTYLHSLRLILNCDIENIDVRTIDPFNASILSDYKVKNIIKIFDENIFHNINKLMK
ncbi:RNA pseudouridylate synthase domain-containing protein 1 isoform X1 [Camponotus floridanus]|uniref:RNA pseudouridylate synthase domain-containing protein 1 isoform X1 n=1 Tax=Camponotus floridanus TaxID=104421 RepID=UPI00059DD8B1|nr:RNA pseudouridylate synthase domain-containing protein 1 isoform X1 [Camponotus floridanus]